LHFKRSILTSKIAFHNSVVCALNGVLIFHIVVHTQCMCTQHQNPILLCNAASLKQDCKDLVFVIVCRTQNVHDSQMWELPWKIYFISVF